MDADRLPNDSRTKTNSTRAESLTPAVRMNMCSVDSTDAFAERPEPDSRVAVAVAVSVVADISRNGSSCSSSPVKRALDSWDRDTHIRYRNPDGRQRRQ